VALALVAAVDVAQNVAKTVVVRAVKGAAFGVARRFAGSAVALSSVMAIVTTTEMRVVTEFVVAAVAELEVEAATVVEIVVAFASEELYEKGIQA